MFDFSWGVKVIVIGGLDYPYLGPLLPLYTIFALLQGRLTATSAFTHQIHI